MSLKTEQIFYTNNNFIKQYTPTDIYLIHASRAVSKITNYDLFHLLAWPKQNSFGSVWYVVSAIYTRNWLDYARTVREQRIIFRCSLYLPVMLNEKKYQMINNIRFKIIAGKKLTKFPNFTRFLPEKCPIT